jgi:hypothetical protein
MWKNNMPQKQQKGFVITHILLVLVVLGIIGFTGWYVWKAQKNVDKDLKPVDSGTSATKPKQSNKTDKPVAYKAPAGYRTYENFDAGFSFAYPEQFGELKAQANSKAAFYAQTQSVQDIPGKGVSGAYALMQHKALSETVFTRKYGPDVSYDNGKWIIKSTNPATGNEGAVGDVYTGNHSVKAWEVGSLVTQDNAGLTIYAFNGGDEGGYDANIRFVVNSKLWTLSVPEFSDDDTYATGDQKPVVNDRKPYDVMLKNVFDSIRPLKQ